MKKQILPAMMMAIAVLAVVSCGPKSDLPGFSKTKSGLHYKFLTENPQARQVQEGDILYGELLIRLNEADTLYANINLPGNLIKVGVSQFAGDRMEAFKMMHEGDRAVFAVDADEFAKFYPMPASYRPGQGDKMYYEVNLMRIVPAAEVKEEEDTYLQNMQDLQAEEPAGIAQYLTEKGITVQPKESGLYVVVNKKGNGPVAKAGSTVSVHYTGTFLDGTQFDSSLGGQPWTLRLGETSVIRGFEEGLLGQSAGSKITLVLPSSLAYGASGFYDEENDEEIIPPYCPLVFDIEILSVN